MFDFLAGLFCSSPRKVYSEIERLKDEQEAVRWDRLSNVHTAFCEESIKTIVELIERCRRQSLGLNKKLVISFNQEKRCAQVHEKVGEELILIAEIEMEGSDGFPDCIKVTNYALETHEVELFRAVRDSRSSFSNWEFGFSVKMPKI